MKNKDSLLMHSEHLRQEQAQQSSPWRTDEPPKDGSPIVAIGKVMYSDDISTFAEPFVAAITWGSTRFQDIKTGWHFWRDGMSLPATLKDEVIIHYWLPMPPAC